MRRWSIVLCLLALPFPAAAAAPRLSLDAGEAVFWEGPHIESSTGGDSWTYTLEVTEPGYRLRLGIDHPEHGDIFDVDVVDPTGDSTTFSSGQGLYSTEWMRLDPAVGTWKVTVRTVTVTDSPFRMRAKLEATKPSFGTAKGPVLPNLQVLPPHEATFVMPVTNGAATDPQGADLMGAESCHPEEHVEDGALRCLRFAFGIRNTGLGPLQLFHNGSIPNDGELFQRVEYADGGHRDRPAGAARYHKTHGHYHHHDAVALRLYRVTDRKTGAMEAAGDKHFKGFAHRDELLREWDRFYPIWTHHGFGLAAGWADIYEWDRPGNYIDFGLNGDGHYLVRMWADPVKGVSESNERDNAGYTYMKVTGSEIELIEAGRGTDPWDPCKIEVGFGGHPDPRSAPRPARCPADTV
ncbi:MAG TPA: lysyl oxidase family protein [Actinomycetota bacterium]|nr:lysyl oxidase family protein [Actinomycetota bacterium]